MKTILIFQYFDCRDATRKAEFIDCINHNISLGFDEIIIFNESVDPPFSGSNIKNVRTNKRLSYRDYIEVVTNPAYFGSLIILTNTDIKLDPKILGLPLKERGLFVFSRYEQNKLLAETPWATQDTWALLGQPLAKGVWLQTEFPLGVPGCELRFAEIIYSAGLAVFNPCLSIKNIHIHSEQKPHSNEDRLYGAYVYTPACTLEDISLGKREKFPAVAYLTAFMAEPARIH